MWACHVYALPFHLWWAHTSRHWLLTLTTCRFDRLAHVPQLCWSAIAQFCAIQYSHVLAGTSKYWDSICTTIMDAQVSADKYTKHGHHFLKLALRNDVISPYISESSPS
ncbi:hypothetical protein M011DRAFT_468719 [Sporormia fimetaria CBS 119925]|uniref:Secreted protein n=1 Tax=Sporormia fimetaria CBS 119925 TaxID=1340428 RepID=A0A6A6VAR5_9PLEO|nr:hypothetical protein M011DRAFT_468719 [Sporormia fimetaria CBS 119925]